MSITLHDPETWLETCVRGLKDYAEIGFQGSVLDSNGFPVGEEVYEIIMEFPSTENLLKMLPLSKVVIHFEIDDIDDRILGFGEGHHRLNYDPVLEILKPQEAGEHRINLDVGIWCSSRSGGVTARLRAYQTLKNLFYGALAIDKLRNATTQYIGGQSEGGLEILEFTGGRFFQETINDIQVFRMINCQLVIRCFSRTPVSLTIPTIEEITIVPELIIDDNLQLPMGQVAKDKGVGDDNATKTP